MTRETMLAALEQIEKTPKGHVYGARRGIVAGAHRQGAGYIGFRRNGHDMYVEEWPSDWLITSQTLPAELQMRVALMLDNL